MNVEEPDKFEQFMSWVQETGKAMGAGLDWLVRHAELVAIMSAVPIVVLAVSLILVIRWWRPKHKPEMPVMRHARR